MGQFCRNFLDFFVVYHILHAAEYIGISAQFHCYRWYKLFFLDWGHTTDLLLPSTMHALVHDLDGLYDRNIIVQNYRLPIACSRRLS